MPAIAKFSHARGSFRSQGSQCLLLFRPRPCRNAGEGCKSGVGRETVVRAGGSVDGGSIDADTTVRSGKTLHLLQELPPADLFQCTAKLVALQIVCGYAVSPLVGKSVGLLFSATPEVGLSTGPVVSQLLLLYLASVVVKPALVRNGARRKEFFRYIARPKELVGSAGAAFFCIFVSVLLNKLDGDPQEARSASEMVNMLNTANPIAMLGTGLATTLAPIVEERIYRGVLLQGLLPKIGTPAAVLASSAVYAGSHLSKEGFVPLFVLGCILGTTHVVSDRNLLVPTVTHSLYNILIFSAVLIRATGLD